MLIFDESICIYAHERYSFVIFLSYNRLSGFGTSRVPAPVSELGVSILACFLVRVCVWLVSFLPKCLLEFTTGTIWSSLCFYFKFNLSVRYKAILILEFIVVSTVMIWVFQRTCPSNLSVGIGVGDVSYHITSAASVAMSTLLFLILVISVFFCFP